MRIKTVAIIAVAARVFNNISHLLKSPLEGGIWIRVEITGGDLKIDTLLDHVKMLDILRMLQLVDYDAHAPLDYEEEHDDDKEDTHLSLWLKESSIPVDCEVSVDTQDPSLLRVLLALDIDYSNEERLRQLTEKILQAVPRKGE